jgi:putative membrane protein
VVPGEAAPAVPEHPGGALLIAVILLGALAGYLACGLRARRRGSWPAYRDALWCAGIVVAAVTLTGPLAEAAHHEFVAHMAGHLLLGMLAPLLLVLAAPVTLALRALPARPARRLSWLLTRRPIRVLTHPVTAAALNLGGLWLLYTAGLYQATVQHAGLHAAVHVHMLAAGYLFTFAIVGVDPSPHRPGYLTRAVVLVLFLAAHAVLAKQVYGHAPAGVPNAQAASGAVLMYYGGDLIDVALITVFCWQWFTACRPNRAACPTPPHGEPTASTT